jgi:hypothetical protein
MVLQAFSIFSCKIQVIPKLSDFHPAQKKAGSFLNQLQMCPARRL